MHIRKLSLSVAAILAISSAPANAEMDSAEMLARIDKGSLEDKIALISYKTAYDWSNSQLQYEKRQPFFCTPPKLSMTPDQIVEILREYVKNNMGSNKMPAGLTMLWALTDTFPCSKSTPGTRP